MIRSAVVTLSAVLALSGSALGQTESKPAVTPEDYDKWESLGFGTLSPDGAWFAYSVNRQSGENDLHIRRMGGEEELIVPFATSATFSPDSRWIAYLVGVSPDEREKLQKQKKPVRNTLVYRNLATEDTVAVMEIASFSFSADGKFISLRRHPSQGTSTIDVLVRELEGGSQLTFGSVSTAAWADVGALLAFTIETEDGVGNGVQLYDGSTAVVRVLESSEARYRGLSWRGESADLAVYRSRPDTAFRDTANLIVAWTDVSAPSPASRTMDPKRASGFPAGMRAAEYRSLRWSSDGGAIYFGLQKRKPVADAPPKSEEKISDVEIWHPDDVIVMEGQKDREFQSLRGTMLAAWKMGENRVIQIGTDPQESATVLEGDRYATETDRTPYSWGWMFGRRDRDIHVVDLQTGERRMMLEKVRHFFGGSQTGAKLSWFDGKDYWMVDIESEERTNLTAKLTRGRGRVDFVNRDDDHPNDVSPPIGRPRWTKDDGALLANTEYDVWSLALDGSGGTRLTDGASEKIVHRILSFGGFFAPSSDDGPDLSEPLYLTLYGKKTKNSGYGRLMPEGSVERLLFADAGLGRFAKADSADVFVFTRQRYDESPNYYAAGPDLSDPRRLSDTNSFQEDYAWGRAELIDFKSTAGLPLQAILYYPPNYDPSKKYPMIVYTYEMLSQGLHDYVSPGERAYNTTAFLADGYLVLRPDIVFPPRQPGIATLHAVEGAVKKVIGMGIVDPKRIGHCGHSQGGYQAAYLGTYSKMFATTVSGAGITDMISFAGQLHWGGGTPEFDHWETGQFRMEVAPWEDFEAMLENSPLHKVHEMGAKSMLLEVGEDDGVVDMRQGPLFYNYARRAGKHVVMLIYPGEGHGLRKEENAIDYHRRIHQWFAHYLKGEPAATWITEGQSWMERKEMLEANK